MSTKSEKQLRDIWGAVYRANSKPKAKPTPETGIDKIIAHLVKHKAQIGAIVVGVAAKPGAQITGQQGGLHDGLMFSADVTHFDGREGDSRRTILTRGLVSSLVSVHLDR